MRKVEEGEMIFDERKPVGSTFLDLKRARKWDERSAKLESNYLEKSRRIAQQLNLTETSTVVDLGCGSGFFTLELSKFCKKILAVDISPVMLDLLSEKILSNDIPNIKCIHKGILEFLSEHDHADALILQVAFHHLPDFWKAVSIHHMARVLKPGGRVFLSDVIFSFPVSEYKEHFEELIDLIASKGDDDFTKDAVNHLLEEHSTFDWVLEGMFQKSGFMMKSKSVKSSTYCDYVFEKE
ncbi:ribosomal RNA adenine dimethylase [Chitinispirillum alkaliphilum]|nr:ribosomal RNA adenine dimethylase [Chitinispirillum alkaliphilum]